MSCRRGAKLSKVVDINLNNGADEAGISELSTQDEPNRGEDICSIGNILPDADDDLEGHLESQSVSA